MHIHRRIGILALAIASLLAGGARADFIRGDADGDGSITPDDALLLENHLFAGEPLPPPLDRADVNDNEYVTYADLLHLSDHLGCVPAPPLPPPTEPGEDPDDDTRGFDEIAPAYAIHAAIELTGDKARLTLALEIPPGTQARAAVIVLRFDDGARPEPPYFCPASGVRLVRAIPDGTRLLLTLRGADCGVLPLPGAATGRIDLGTAVFAHGGTVACATQALLLEPEHTPASGVAVRASIIDVEYRDRRPALAPIACAETSTDFRRGDANGDARIDIADPIATLSYLFAAGEARCLDAMDANDDGGIDIADAVFSLAYTFAAGPPPPPPFGACGPDPTPGDPCRALGCREGCSSPPAAESPWPMFRHDLRHTGRTDFTGPPAPSLAWTFKAAEGIVSSPSIGAGGTIYFGSGWEAFSASNNYLYALQPDGRLKWQYGPVKGFFSSPALGPGGMVYLTGLDGYLYAIRDAGAAGELAWRTSISTIFCLSSPTIGRDGTIYAGSTDFKLYAVAPDGSIRWAYPSDWCIISSPAIDERGIVHVGSKDERLFALRPSGALEWAFAAGEFYDGRLIDSSPAIGADGTVYFGTDQYGAFGMTPVPSTTNFWAVNPDGTFKWVFLTEDGVESSPAIGRDGTLYFGSYDSHLYAVVDAQTHGALAWKFKTGGAIDGSPTIDGNGIIYFGSRDGTLYALYPDGRVKWTFQAGDGIESSPTIDARGYLYFGSFDGNLYALGTGGPDVGVSALDLPASAAPETLVTPRAVIANYRGAPQRCDATCTIAAGETILYSDTIPVQLGGGARRTVTFLPWTAGAEAGASYTITVATAHPEDENPENDSRTAELGT
ncbi:MAG TPA: hypothetical protein DCM87_13730 [Planctomycetes bacterium]|nr:hypothetical protein [Planctomycetota bacterium]